MKVLLPILLLICTAGVCSAKTEYKFSSGECEGHTVGWWSTSRYDNGRLVETWGVDCYGTQYHTYARVVTIDAPLSGNPVDAGICDGTPSGTAWFAVVNRSASGVAVEAWGRDCSGLYWRATIEPSGAHPDALPGAARQGAREHDMR